MGETVGNGAVLKTVNPILLVRKLLQSKALIVVVDQAFVSLSSFLAMVILAKSCGGHELGIYGLAFALLWMLLSFPNSTIWVPFTNKAPRISKRRLMQYQLILAYHILCVVGLMALPALALAVYLNERPVFIFCGSFAFLSGMLLREHMRRVFMAMHQFHTVLAIDAPTSILQVVSLVCISFTTHLSAPMSMLVIGTINAVPFLGYFIQLTSVRVSRRMVWRTFLGHWQLGRWLIGVSLTTTGADVLLRFAITTLLGNASHGQFAASIALQNIANPLILTAANYFRVDFSDVNSKQGVVGVCNRYAVVMRFFAMGAALFFGSIALVGEWATPLLFGDEFAGLGVVIAINSLAVFISALGLVSDAMLTTINKGKELSIASASRLLCTIFFAVPLIGYFGLVGASTTLSVGYVAMLCVHFWYISKTIREQADNSRRLELIAQNPSAKNAISSKTANR